MKRYYVYMLSNHTKMLYTGVTNDLYRRMWEHKLKVNKGFTSRYNLHQLVYFEEFQDIYKAIAREKEIKGWRRSKKVNLIKCVNPGWKDLFEGSLSGSRPPDL